MRQLAAALTFLFLLAGCGQMGPLYLPQKEAPADTPVETGAETPAEA